MKEIGLLDGAVYSEHKLKVKAVFKKYGMKFNQGACLSANLYLWQGEGIQAEGKFTKDDEGVTIRAEIILTAEERVEAFDKLREIIEKLGGSWSVASEEEVKEESVKEEEDERMKFLKEWKHKLVTEERNARAKGFKKCPIIIPMINKFLEEYKTSYPAYDAPTAEAVYDAIVRELEGEKK